MIEADIPRSSSQSFLPTPSSLHDIATAISQRVCTRRAHCSCAALILRRRSDPSKYLKLDADQLTSRITAMLSE